MVAQRIDGLPDLLSVHAADPQRYPFMLESVAHGTAQSRYDILFAFPQARIMLAQDGMLTSGDPGYATGGGFLATLEQAWREESIDSNDAAELPFTGGWFVLLGYELAAEVEPSLDLPRAETAVPGALAARIPAAVIKDHAAGATWLVAEDGAAGYLELMRDDVGAAVGEDAADIPAVSVSGLREAPAADFLAQVARIKDYIVEGDVFQVNLSRRWQGTVPAHTPDGLIYRNLRRANPAPFAGMATGEGWAVMSSSPERLAAVRGGLVHTRPIAGTHPRGASDEDDGRLARGLLSHPKERAEHLMLIDLERNDLGRICVPGSIKVDDFMGLESYTHVHHIVSNVSGVLRDDTGPVDVIRALFPGGTITGCPKVRCMEIIAELEGTGRGSYTGSMGYINRDGSLDLNILIRGIERDGDNIRLQAGAGIVADSVPERELQETRAKAAGMLQALTGQGA